MIAAFLLAQALLAQAGATAAPSPGMRADAARLEACVAKIDRKPEEAYEDALVWAHDTHSRESRICQALAMIALKRIAEGALLLEQLADSGDGGDKAARASLYSQAGNARLLAFQPVEAAAALSEALKYAPRDPDLLIDRARSYALQGDWGRAESDLSAALDTRPQDALALRLRAEARLQQNVFDLAEKDAAEAARIAPKDVEALLVVGRVKEARRTGKPPG